jgi:hypothetical protein
LTEASEPLRGVSPLGGFSRVGHRSPHLLNVPTLGRRNVLIQDSTRAVILSLFISVGERSPVNILELLAFHFAPRMGSDGGLVDGSQGRRESCYIRLG